MIRPVQVGGEKTYSVHNQRSRDADRNALKRILNHQPRVDFINCKALKEILERTDPLQPPQHRRDIVQMHKEPGKGHLIQTRQGTEQNRNTPVLEERPKKKVLEGLREERLLETCESFEQGRRRTKRVIARE